MRGRNFNMRCSFNPYEGKEKYIFISYSHSDSEIIIPILEELNSNGYRIWYDDGIEWGSEWPESVAQHLHNCEICMAFHSYSSILSPNCRQEINYALKKNKGILSVYLEDVELSDGMDMQLTSYQSTFLYQYDNMNQFFKKLIHTQLLQCCRIDFSATSLKKKFDTNCENVKADSKYSFDKELEVKFGEIKKKTEEESILVKKIKNLKVKKFIEEFEEEVVRNDKSEKETFNAEISLTPVEWQYTNPYYGCESWTGWHFTLPNIPGVTTRVFEMIRKIDYDTLSAYYICELLDSTISDDEKETTYYEDYPQHEGNELIILHFKSNEVYVNTGILKDDKVSISKRPIIIEKSQNIDKTELYLNPVAYNTRDMTDEMLLEVKCSKENIVIWREADISESVPIVIDSDTALPVKRELYYDELSQGWKARIKLIQDKLYYAFQVKVESPELSNMEIATYYRNGLYEFPKDIIKAIEYLEKENTALSTYQISDIFRNEKSVSDYEMYSKYLRLAISKGCDQAIIEDAINKYLKNEKEESNTIWDSLTNLKDESGLKDFVMGYFIETSYFQGKENEAYDYYWKSACKHFKPALVRLGRDDIDLEKVFERRDYNENRKNGLALAHYAMGAILYYGIGINSEMKEGIQVFEKAAELGSKLAMKELYRIYGYGSIFENRKRSLYLLRKLEEDDKSLSNELANRLWDGIGCEQNNENDIIAYRITEKLAQEGNRVAQHNLGWANRMGRGCTVNYKEAMKLFMEAQRPSSYFYIADMYENGLGVDCNQQEALKYYQIAADKGSKRAIDRLKKMSAQED